MGWHTFSLDTPATRREFHFDLRAAWRSVVMIAASAVGEAATWRDLLLPPGALAMPSLHAAAHWRALRRDRTADTPAA